VSITSKRKKLALRRRNVEEELNKASAKYKELEKELEEACEAEDFESAERISNSLASMKNDKNQLHLDLRSLSWTMNPWRLTCRMCLICTSLLRRKLDPFSNCLLRYKALFLVAFNLLSKVLIFHHYYHIF
jgi:UvrB/uvrC motif